jgi:cytochrome c553
LGLPRDYLNAQLGSWQTGLRQAQAPDCMAAIAKRLNESDVHALSNWLASQPLPAQPRAATQRAPLPPGAKDIRCGSAPW